jgi:hypothetical protein
VGALFCTIYVCQANFRIAKLMGNGTQHAIAVGAAAHLCAKHNVVPSQIYERYIWDLQSLVADINSPVKTAARL